MMEPKKQAASRPPAVGLCHGAVVPLLFQLLAALLLRLQFLVEIPGDIL
jgi:hypothetical protein